MTCIRPLVVGLLLLRAGFDPRPVNVSFVVDEVTVGKGFFF
jgi:hypothetical protein